MVVVASAAQAADVRLRASGECATRAELVDQVDELLGRPIADVEGLDFEVEINQGAGHKWRLQVVTVARADGARRSRQIDGADCAQLAEAAAVAITMSVQARPVTPSPADRSLAQEPPRIVVNPASPNRQPAALSLGLSALGDAATLPDFGFGLGLSAIVGWSRLSIIGEGELFAGREKRLADSSGGSFRLIAGAALFCFTSQGEVVDILVCAGGEAGLVQAEGLGVGHPRLRNVAWEAGRLEIGAVRRLNPTVSLFLRGGVAVPWSRPTFRLNDTEDVFRSGSVAGRVALGAQFALF
jgi:hypothetical protein